MRSVSARSVLAPLARIDRSPIPAHIELATILRALMSGEPTKPKSQGEVSAAQQAASGKAGSLPEAKPAASEEIAAFVAKARAMSPLASGARGRLVFALDATMSRQPTWDMACALQADMFREAAAIGSLDIRLVYYRGLNECRASNWISDTAHLAKLMSGIACQGGNPQIGKVLSEARPEALPSPIPPVAFAARSHPAAVCRGCYYIGRMPTLIAGAVAVILLYSLLQMFRAANPVVLARTIKIGGGVVALAGAAFTGIKGELAVAIPLGIFGAGLLGWSPFRASGFGNISCVVWGAGCRR